MAQRRRINLLTHHQQKGRQRRRPGEAMDKIDDKNKAKKTMTDVSRRKFITKAMAGAGATTVIALGENRADAADTPETRLIKVPDAFAQSAKATPTPAAFPMNGALASADVVVLIGQYCMP